MQAQRFSVQCISPAGLHRMSYKQWGDPNNPKVLMCVHGLTRVSDDFDVIAQALQEEYRVVCPDVVGRGQSDHLANPAYYQIPQYVSDIVTLIACVSANNEATTIDWLGTSMGGLIGMVLASLPNNPIQKLILNDVGPTINAEALQRIGTYLGEDIRFNSFEEAEKYIRAISFSFGPHSEEQWIKLAKDVLKQDAEGKWMRQYDLNLALPIKSMTPEAAKAGQAMLWSAYDAITCPTLLMRGSESDLLSHATGLEMQNRGPRATMVEIVGVGHAPTLLQADQIDIVRQFLLKQTN